MPVPDGQGLADRPNISITSPDDSYGYKDGYFSFLKPLVDDPAVMGSTVSLLSGLGILALRCTLEQFEQLKAAQAVKLSNVTRESEHVEVQGAGQQLQMSWLATGEERGWTLSGSLGPG